MFDPIELRNAFGKFLTGVTVITACDADGTPRGFTANSFTSVSLDPALLLVCIAKSALSSEVFHNSKGFAVNILSDQQIDVSKLFASKRPDKFDHIDWRPSHSNAPILSDVLCWFDCATENRVDAGDHFLLLGEVRNFGTSEADPLGFSQGQYVFMNQNSSLCQLQA